MRVHHAAGRRFGQVDLGVDKKSGRLGLVLSFQAIALRIDDQQVTGREFRPVQALRVQQELVTGAGNQHAEVVADALAQPLDFRPAERDEQFQTGLEDRVRVCECRFGLRAEPVCYGGLRDVHLLVNRNRAGNSCGIIISSQETPMWHPWIPCQR